MSNDELIIVDPQDLKFPFEVKKQISCSFQMANKTDNYVAFKIKTTNPKKYSVRPNNGIILPRAMNSVTVTMQAQKEAPADMQCNDKFLVQSVVAPAGATPKDINTEMFNKEEGNRVEECKLRVVYVHPPRPPSPVPEESEEETSESTSVVSRGYAKPQDTPSESKDLISRLTMEKQSIIQENEKLHQELELLRRGPGRNRGGVSIYVVLLIGLLGLLLGYYMKNLSPNWGHT